jgi:hypothetical protein
MAVFRIKGGLGNQLFQFAAAYALNKAKGCHIFLDKSFFVKRPLHEGFLLDGIETSFDIGVCTFLRQAWQKLNGRLPKALRRGFFEEGLEYDESFFEHGCGSSYEGYFHSAKYFSACKQEVIKTILTAEKKFSNSYHKSLEKFDFSKTVAIHVRRGDYTNQTNAAIYETCSIEYYFKALRQLFDLHSGKIETILVFTDDSDYVKKSFNFSEFNIKTNFASDFSLSSFEEMILMSKCAYIITANSTFSWWSAYLSQTDSDKIYMPKRWFLDGRTYDLQSVDWRKVDN